VKNASHERGRISAAARIATSTGAIEKGAASRKVMASFPDGLEQFRRRAWRSDGGLWRIVGLTAQSL
jgi:hypothetical protein